MFALCGIRSKTDLADHRRRANKEKDVPRHRVAFSIPNLLCIYSSWRQGIALPRTTFFTFLTLLAWLLDLNLDIHIIHTVSRLLCLSAFTWTDIANSELWPTTVSLLPDDHALQPGHHLLLWVLRLFSTHPAGHLRLLHPINRLISNWT